VICTPEFIEKNVSKDSCYCITASDGVWEFLSNKQVCDINNKFYSSGDYNGMVKNLIREASIEWNNDGICRDDITLVVHFFKEK
jgi:serine/threonine protein phosphatase PrpC